MLSSVVYPHNPPPHRSFNGKAPVVPPQTSRRDRPPPAALRHPPREKGGGGEREPRPTSKPTLNSPGRASPPPDRSTDIRIPPSIHPSIPPSVHPSSERDGADSGGGGKCGGVEAPKTAAVPSPTGSAHAAGLPPGPRSAAEQTQHPPSHPPPIPPLRSISRTAEFPAQLAPFPPSFRARVSVPAAPSAGGKSRGNPPQGKGGGGGSGGGGGGGGSPAVLPARPPPPRARSEPRPPPRRRRQQRGREERRNTGTLSGRGGRERRAGGREGRAGLRGRREGQELCMCPPPPLVVFLLLLRGGLRAPRS